MSIWEKAHGKHLKTLTGRTFCLSHSKRANQISSMPAELFSNSTVLNIGVRGTTHRKKKLIFEPHKMAVCLLSSRLRHQPRLAEERQHVLLLQRHRQRRLHHGHEPLLPREGPARLHPQSERTGVREQHGTPFHSVHTAPRAAAERAGVTIVLLFQVGTGEVSVAWIGMWKAGIANGEYRCVEMFV